MSQNLRASDADAVDTRQHRVRDVVELEAGRHVRNEAHAMRAVHELQRILESEL